MRAFGRLSCVLCGLTAIIVSASSMPATGSQKFPFEIKAAGEGVAEITASAPGASWERSGAEASVATIYLDDQYNQDIVIDHGSEPWTYSVVLGPLHEGSHELRVERNSKWSAAGAGLQVQNARFRVLGAGSADFAALSHAPYLYARADTLGHFSDVPLLMWYEVFPEGAGSLIQYSIVFTNEDAGTPMPALMARWGRGTDIEYAYRVHLDAAGSLMRESFQGFHHDEVPFQGRHAQNHPLLLVATPNNVFADTGATELQYHMLPVPADLSHHSREELMDQFPWTYKIMAEELQREGKIRPFGMRSENAAGDARSYLYFEMDAENQQSGLVAWAKLKGESKWYSSSLGAPELAISRSGWFRTAVELPPGTRTSAVEFVGVECVDLREPHEREGATPSSQPESLLRSISKVFMLDADYRPGPQLLSVEPALAIHPGDFYTWAIGHRP